MKKKNKNYYYYPMFNYSIYPIDEVARCILRKKNFLSKSNFKNKNFFQKINYEEKLLVLIKLIFDWLIKI
jgi:hypothetical protein